MYLVTRSVFVSLAYQTATERLGGNWRLELGAHAEVGEQPDLAPHLEFLREQLDHRCLWEDLENFKNSPSSPARVCAHFAPLVFGRALRGGRWASFTIHENAHARVTAYASKAPLTAELKTNNLTLSLRLEGSEGLDRDSITREVRDLFTLYKEPSTESEEHWARLLFSDVSARLPTLFRLRIDLGRQKYIVVDSKL